MCKRHHNVCRATSCLNAMPCTHSHSSLSPPLFSSSLMRCVFVHVYTYIYIHIHIYLWVVCLCTYRYRYRYAYTYTHTFTTYAYMQYINTLRMRYFTQVHFPKFEFELLYYRPSYSPQILKYSYSNTASHVFIFVILDCSDLVLSLYSSPRWLQWQQTPTLFSPSNRCSSRHHRYVLFKCIWNAHYECSSRHQCTCLCECTCDSNITE